MNNGRLFGIIYHLLNTKKTTSTELSNLFEVSTRTIYRDLDVLSAFGIPICTEPGRNGGIYLLDNFILDKVLLSKKEQEHLLLALKGIESVTPEISEQSYSKLQSVFNLSFHNWLEVDFSPWYQERSNLQFELLKSGVLAKKQVEFDYISSKGQSEKRVCNPVKLVFKSQTWYLQAFCLNRNEFRFFKISRMSSLRMTDETFASMTVPKVSKPEMEGELLSLKLCFSKEILYRVFDEFKHDEIAIQPDGTAIVSTQMPDQKWLIRHLLSYGKHMKILSPDSLKCRMKQEIAEVLSNYAAAD